MSRSIGISTRCLARVALAMLFGLIGHTAMAQSVQGTATYRERITLPPGAMFEATLEDVSRADAAASIIARTRRQTRQSTDPVHVDVRPGENRRRQPVCRSGENPGERHARLHYRHAAACDHARKSDRRLHHAAQSRSECRTGSTTSGGGRVLEGTSGEQPRLRESPHPPKTRIGRPICFSRRRQLLGL